MPPETEAGTDHATGNLSVMPDKPKRRRRTRAEIEELREEIYNVCRHYQPLTVRQAFYRLVVLGFIEKTQRAYKNTLIPQMKKMREDGELPFDWIVDNTRLMRKPRSFVDLGDMLRQQQRFYRKNIWADQDVAVEIWCESDSAAGVLTAVTEEWDVPLMSARGFSSITFLHQSAEMIAWREVPTHIYYFGDHDPSGVHIDRNIHDGLVRYGADGFTFERVAVTEEQIEELDLPGSPPKKTDSRSRGFNGDAVEIEAISPIELRSICSACITQHIDDDALERCRIVEQAELETLQAIVERQAEDTAS
ncbi:MAG: hypothetical protein AAFV43_16555 [Planctomycetota bacterium]